MFLFQSLSLPLSSFVVYFVISFCRFIFAFHLFSCLFYCSTSPLHLDIQILILYSHEYRYDQAVAFAGQSARIKTIQCGPIKKTINPNGIFHYRYFITSLQGTHHRTETSSHKWKNVLSLRTKGTVFSWVQGEDVDAKIAALERQEMTKDMISNAQGMCDRYTNLPCQHGKPHAGDCLCAPWV